MGGGQSKISDKDKQSQDNVSHNYNVGREVVYAMYNKFQTACTDSNKISKDSFDVIFPIIHEDVKKEMLKYLDADKDGAIDFDGFFRLYFPLRPSVSNKEFKELLYTLFRQKDGNFNAKLFISELKANMFFTHKGSDVVFEQQFNLGPGHESITKEEFDTLTKNVNSPVLLYGRQYIFGSFLFQ